MARIRTVKPEFWISEQVMELSRDARLLFIGLWNFSDDGGNHPASPKSLKAEVFPGDDLTAADIQRLVDEMSAQGLVFEYEAEGKTYWHVTGWHHQKIDRPNCRHPAPPENPHEQDVRRTLDEPIRRTLDEQSTPEGKVREGKGKERKVKEESFPPEAAHVASTVVELAENQESAASSRIGEICKLLRKAGINTGPELLKAHAWVSDPTATDDLIETAIAKAKQNKPGATIHPNYLRPIIDDLLHPPAPIEAKANGKQPPDAWWMTNAGIERKGKELDMRARGTESYNDFKDRIFAEIRKRQGGNAA